MSEEQHEDTEPIQARVPRELAARIRALAHEGDRTIGRQIARLLRIGVEAEEKAAVRVTP